MSLGLFIVRNPFDNDKCKMAAPGYYSRRYWCFLFLTTVLHVMSPTVVLVLPSPLGGGEDDGGGNGDNDHDDELFEYRPCEGGGSCSVSSQDCFFREFCNATNFACAPETGEPPARRYRDKSAAFKFRYLWNRILKSANTTQSPAKFTPTTLIPRSSSILPFIADADVWARGHRKVVHSAYGTVAKVRFVVDRAHDHPFTGILKTGSRYGILRFSNGAPFGRPGLGNFVIPGFAIKFLRDGGMPSGNMFGIRFVHAAPLDSPEANFLTGNYSNHGTTAERLPAPELRDLEVLLDKFSQASLCPQFLGISDLAMPIGKNKGRKPPVFPFEVVLVPRLFAPGVNPFPPNLKPDSFIKVFEKFPRGTLLYNVYARSDPSTADANIYLGDIVSKSRFVASKFADKRLLMHHTPFEQDLRYHPEWLDMMSDWRTECFSSLPDRSLPRPMRLSPPRNASVVLPLTCPFSGLIP